MSLKGRIIVSGALALFVSVAYGQLSVEIGKAATPEAVGSVADREVRRWASKLDAATRQVRADLARTGHYHPQYPVSFPTVVWLNKNGRRFAPARKSFGGPPGSGITLQFDSTGARAFPPAYQSKLQGIFNSVQSTLDSDFGAPAQSGVVAVKDYNADISDRGFFSGGFYIPNGASGPEIHFPEYADDASTAVNFIHCLLLAYLGPYQYGYDAFNEGLVRAVTMQVARTPAALPGYDQNAIENVLENSYDVGPWYDWYNQRALGGSHFVAPNLADQPLVGVGGLYLLRYRMAGSAWQKIVAEHPGFVAAYNAQFYANPSIASDVSALEDLAQTTLNTIAPGGPTVEGYTFAEWFKRQFVLETNDTEGRKVLVQPVPLTGNLQAGDFGPYLLQTNYFQTLAGGDEALSTATSYPIYWVGDIGLTRVFTDVQDERIDITGSYGEVAPNFPDLDGGTAYRMTVDVPVDDQLSRVYLPAGSIATATNPTPNDLYGTVTGVYLQAGESLRLQVSVGGQSLPDVPVTDQGAFGTLVGTQSYLGYNTVTLSVVKHGSQGDTTLLTRTVDKGPGALALDLRVASDGNYTWPFASPKGISMVGFPVDPWASFNPDIVGSSTLVARYDPSVGRYNLFPDAEAFKIGHGYFLRRETQQLPFTVSGRVYRNISGSVALKPGWNMICDPLTETTPVSSVWSVHAADFPEAFTDALGTSIGTEFYEFQPGANDAASGAPESGSMVPATQFEEGKAYFVQVLSPEGVTLVFDPQAGLGPIRKPHALGSPPPPGWLMKTTLSDGSFSIGAEIGQTTTATSGFDPKQDAQLPPALSSGRQVQVVDFGTMYRDVRRLGSPQTFTLEMTGLAAGRTYRLSFDRVRNSPGTFLILKSNGSVAGYGRVGQSITFRAAGPTEVLKIRVTGGLGQ